MSGDPTSSTDTSHALVRRLLPVGLCFVIAEALLLRLAEAGHLDAVRAGIASVATAGLSGLGHRVALSGFSVATTAGMVTVAISCLPIVHVSLVLALFGFGVPSPLPRRLLWIAGLTGVALVLEVVRIMTVTTLFEAGSASLDYVHLTVMPALTLGVVVCSWLFELRASSRV